MSAGRVALCAAIGCVVLLASAGCASAGEKAGDVCRSAGEQVGALPTVTVDSVFRDVPPILDRQMDIARRSRDELAGISPAEDQRAAFQALLDRWDGLTASTRNLRDALLDSNFGKVEGFSNDIQYALNVAAKQGYQKRDVDALRDAANAAAAPDCGSIPWRGVTG